MKALIYTGIAGNKVEIIDKEKPSPAAGQVLIKMVSAALNHRDQWMRVDKYPNMKAGVTLGSDGFGIVEQVGKGADGDWVGKEVIINPNNNWGDNPNVQSPDYHVLGMPADGTFAEYLVVNEDRIFPKPDHLNDAEAAALPLGGLTAFRAVFTNGQITKNSKVLITGIGGGVALFALQFCVATKAQAYVTSGSPEKIRKAIKLGALNGFNYQDSNWSRIAKEKTQGFDVIVDSAGGNSINHYLRAVKPGGKIISYGATLGSPDKIEIFRLFWNQITFQGTTMGNDLEFREMIKFVRKNNIRPVVDSVRPFTEIISALDVMNEGKQMGKMVVSF